MIFHEQQNHFLLFYPSVAGQILCGFVLIKKQEVLHGEKVQQSFLFLSVGACISLITQIYNIPGDLSSFLLTWMLLCLPLVYIMQSSIASLLFLTGITYYAVETSYWLLVRSIFRIIFILVAILSSFALIIIFCIPEKPESNFMIFHNWLIPLSIIISLEQWQRMKEN